MEVNTLVMAVGLDPAGAADIQISNNITLPQRCKSISDPRDVNPQDPPVKTSAPGQRERFNGANADQ